MICCLCTPENPCGPACLRHPPEVRRRNLRPRWWQVRKWFRWWRVRRQPVWASPVRWWQVWRWWRFLTPHYWRTRRLRFPTIGGSGAALGIDAMVSVQPMTAKTTRVFYEAPLELPDA